MADRKSVRAELERKRVQLAQMRQERERRSRMHQEDENTSQNSENRERIEDADAVLQALGLTASLSRVSTAPSTLMTDQTRSDGSSLNNSLVSPLLPQQRQNQSIQAQLSTSLNDSYVMQSTPRVSVPLQVVHVNQINIPPKERLYYTKSTQTHAPIVPPAQLDQTGTTPADAPQQKSYYGKQTKNSISVNPPVLQNRVHQSQTASNNSYNNQNTQATGANLTQLALEWDDEFPGMSRLVLA